MTNLIRDVLSQLHGKQVTNPTETVIIWIMAWGCVSIVAFLFGNWIAEHWSIYFL